MGVYLRTLGAVTLMTAAAMVLRQAPWWTITEGTLEIFFGVFGVVYAIIVGFAMYEALNNYSQIRQHMSAEVNELQDLRDYLMYLNGDEQSKREILAALTRYAESVVQQEWPAMRRDEPLDMDTPPELYAVLRRLRALAPTEERQVLAVERLINTLAEITTHRTNRITASVERLPGLLLQLLAILSLFMVAAFTLIPIEAWGLELLLTVANTFGVAFTYFVILDLDYPFHGVWSLQPTPFENFLERQAAARDGA